MGKTFGMDNEEVLDQQLVQLECAFEHIQYDKPCSG